MNRRMGVWLGAGFLLAAVALGGYLFWFSRAPMSTDGREFVVSPGMTLRAFSRELSGQGVLPDRWTLVVLARLQGQSRGLKTGEYRFRAGMTAFEILDQVVNGRVIEYPFIIVEGWTFREVLDELRTLPRISQTLQGVSSAAIMARLDRPKVHPEGRFFPDTYYYSAGMTDLGLLKRALTRMEEVLVEEWTARAPDVPLDTPDEALVLASIVEKETGASDERAQIAGVFVRRMRLGMRLQTDPSVIYGLGPAFDGNLRLKDLRRYSPYNTYVIRGLPPTPIAMPGREAIHAALNPDDSGAIFFVSRGDGTHEFNATLAGHNRAVARFQTQGRNGVR